MIVEDSPLINDRFMEMLKEDGYAGPIRRATDFCEAVTIMNEQPVDLVLLDIHLRGKDGMELLKTIKEMHPAVKVIMCTNCAGKQYKAACQKLGAVYFIDKSHEFDQIPALVSKLI